MNKNIKNKILLALVICGFSSLSYAGPNPYSDCGIGAALFPDTNWAAVSSNVIFDLGSTAVTSATASPNTCSNKQNVAAIYVRDTYAQLVEESVKGESEHLTAAFELFECGNRNSEALNKVRNDIGEFITSKNYQQKTHIEKSSDLFNSINSACKS